MDKVNSTSSVSVGSAHTEYKQGNYAHALSLYEMLEGKFGNKGLFKTNINLCKRNLEESNSTPVEKVAYPDYLLISRGMGDKVELDSNATYVEIPLTDVDFVKISLNVNYLSITKDKKNKAITVIEYIDKSGQIISEKYKDYTYSKDVGWYKYIYPSESGVFDLYIEPCKGTVLARIGFRSFYTSGAEKVVIDRYMKLFWHRNLSNQIIKSSHKPKLPILPFEVPVKAERKRLNITSVLDAFTSACLSPECNLVPVRPTNWHRELLDQKIDMLFVESAWHGNNNAWDYRIASYEKPPGNELLDIIKWARKYDIPTVFWNKEDPPNFDRFIKRAADFDYVFTTDENCIERYRKVIPKSAHISALPFAAQPSIHNPILEQSRLNAASFAGTYYADDYEPRRMSMDMLLRSAAKYGLDIFDRMYNVTGAEKKRFEFPADLQSCIRGSLSYDEMIKAYRRYRVGLNVNSVSDSPTMFSRRVFELLACGTPVVSTESLGISKIFKGIVPTVANIFEADIVMHQLMTDAYAWLASSVRGMRTVFKSHTYQHRLNEVAKITGLTDYIVPASKTVVVLKDISSIENFMKCLKSQLLTPDEVVVVGEIHSSLAIKAAVESIKNLKLKATAIPKQNLFQYITQRHLESNVCFCDSINYYGPNYIADACNALTNQNHNLATAISTELSALKDVNKISFDEAGRVGLIINEPTNGSVAVNADSELFLEVIRNVFATEATPTLQYISRSPFDFCFTPARRGINDPSNFDLH
jgi:spore maturation protein CgeB